MNHNVRTRRCARTWHRALLFCLALGALGATVSAQNGDAALKLSGSLLNETGYIGFRSDIPDGSTRDWYSQTSATARLSQSGDKTRFFAALWTRFDAATGGWDLSLDEAWGEWSPASFASLRIGRFPLRYGPCVAFNPANSLVAKSPFDSRANKVGLDGLALEMQPLLAAKGGQDIPCSLVVNAALLLPSDVAGSSAACPFDIEESSAHGRITFYAPGVGILGATEVGISGDFRRLGGVAPEGKMPMAGGLWLSADLVGFVIGAEGTLRSPGYGELSLPGASVSSETENGYGWALSVNRRMGDFFALVEASYANPGYGWQGFAQLSRNVDDNTASLSALVDFDTLAARLALDSAWNIGDFLVLHVKAAWNYRPEKWTPQLANEYLAGLSLEYFF
jgi:hypothetical protein